MNSMAHWTSRKNIGVGLILVAMLFVSICCITDNLLSAQASSSKITRTFEVLNHAPIGTATLLWSQTNHTLVVTVIASGLAPKSTHPDAIHNGMSGGCTSPTHGDVVYGLNPINADSSGKGTSVTTISNVQQGIPGQGWYIDVHNGPQLADENQQERIACANIMNPNALISTPQPPNSSNVSTASNATLGYEHLTHGTISNEAPTGTPASSPPSGTPASSPPSGTPTSSPPSGTPTSSPPSGQQSNSQVVNVTLGGSADDDQSLSVGAVELSINRIRGKDRLTVKIFLYRLAPRSSHVAHIHTGSCENQGAVLYPLTTIKADGVGFGTSTTVVNNVSSIPNTGWYVNVHRASPKDDLGNQTNFDPIACVDISESNSLPTNPIITPPAAPNPPATPTPFIE